MSRRRTLPFAVVLVLGAAALAVRADRQDPFPHDAHDGLFPVCTGCHEGVPGGTEAAFFPEPEVCARCHDGVDLERVDWAGREQRVTNLRFAHAEHVAKTEASGDAAECTTCHVPDGAGHMEVRRAVVGQCLACHEDEAESHYADAKCEQCHLPLAQTSFAANHVADLPKPDGHDQDGFLAGRHGEIARTELPRCIVCHTRERCSACHVDAARSQVIAAMPAAGPQVRLPAYGRSQSRAPAPASHAEEAFLAEHGDMATAAEANCAVCHTRESCATCHIAEPPRAVAALPARAQATAPGVQMERRAPASHRLPFYAGEHGVIAATEAASCTQCHTRRFCDSCHRPSPAERYDAAEPALKQIGRRGGSGDSDSPDRTEFHPADYLARHASAAYGRTLECSNCHDVRVFCRDCHEQAGFRSSGRLSPGFHDAEPLWLLRHPQAARQGLESCTSCHTQRDCMQCHSEVGAFQINPHGPDFDPRRAASRNAVICRACHLTDPLGGGPP